ncbi:MAG: hypothetical protein JW991_05545 [Candidatus Pacebacteria bacterium]|nr:hypothetical protein [Candidatus Paceibacterota bacterium]
MNHEIRLSTGSFPGGNLEQAAAYIKKIDYDGLELVPLKPITRQIKEAIAAHGQDWADYLPGLERVRSVHHSWKLDNDLERSHGVKPSPLNHILRMILFPPIHDSSEAVAAIAQARHVPVIIHDISSQWTQDIGGQEFTGGLGLEISSHLTRSVDEVQAWLERKQHHLVADTRDDQAIVWAQKKSCVADWQKLWNFFGLEKIRNIQLTLIGKQGMRKILAGQETLAEKQFLWLHHQNWQGSITVEVNPLTLYTTTRGYLASGLNIFSQFIHTTLDQGQNWS